MTPPPLPERHRAMRRVAALGIGAIIGTTAILAVHAADRYASARASVLDAMETRARLVQEHSERTLQAVELRLSALAGDIARTPWAQVEESRRLWTALRRQADAMPHVESLWVVDQNGQLRLFSAQFPTPAFDAFAQPYYQAHAVDGRRDLALTRPRIGTLDDNATAAASLPLMATPHALRGVAVADLDTGYYTRFISSLPDCSYCTVALVRSNGSVVFEGGPERADYAIARPEIADLLALPELQQAGADRAHLPSGNRAPGTLAAWSATSPHETRTLVAAPVGVIWSLWWRETRLTLIGGTASVIVLAILLLAAWRTTRQVNAINLQLSLASEEAENARQSEAILRRKARDADAAKSRFLAQMSHELRTPLNAIIGFSQIIREQSLGPAHPKYPEYASDIQASGEHLLSLIDDVLDLSRIEARRYDLDESVLEIAAVVEEARRIIEPRARAKHHSLRVHAEALLVKADRRVLRQILLNLMSNAVKYTPDWGEILVTARRHAEGIAVEVHDTGYGMDAADQERAMQPFGQILSQERAPEGTGLGLNIVQAMLEMHGGRFTLDSAPGAGTTVTVYLPHDRLIAAGSLTSGTGGRHQPEAASAPHGERPGDVAA